MSLYSTSCGSTEFPIAITSKVVLRTTPPRDALARWKLFSTPFRMTRFPGSTFPVRSSVRRTASPCGWAPCRSDSGCSCTSIRWASTYVDSSEIEAETGPALRLTASSLGLGAFERLPEDERPLVLGLVELHAAGDALEHRVPDLGTDLGDAPDDPFDRDQVVEVGLPDRADGAVGGRGEADDAQAKAVRRRCPRPGGARASRAFRRRGLPRAVREGGPRAPCRARPAPRTAPRATAPRGTCRRSGGSGAEGRPPRGSPPTGSGAPGAREGSSWRRPCDANSFTGPGGSGLGGTSGSPVYWRALPAPARGGRPRGPSPRGAASRTGTPRGTRRSWRRPARRSRGSP